MTDVQNSSALNKRRLAQMRPIPLYARIAGVLLLITMVAGFFGEIYVPSKLVVPADAGATAMNYRASEFLFRLGFASYLLEALCDVGLVWLFYVLLRPVHKDLALLAAFFGLVSVALFGVAELIYFSASIVLRDVDYLKAFSQDQRNTLALLAFKTYGLGSGIFMSFYGIASILRGYLIYRSNFLPKFLGVLLVLAGTGFVAENFLQVLAPKYVSDLLLLPMFFAVLALTGWFLVKGVNRQKWEDWFFDATMHEAATRRVAP